MIDSRQVWTERAHKYGRRCVYDLSVPESQFNLVTKFQERVLFPLLLASLRTPPKRVLDFGCGAGRFTSSLRKVTGAQHCLGFDICAELVEMASSDVRDSDTAFTASAPEEFFDTLNVPFDLIWIATVLGGVTDSQLTELSRKLALALNSGGLLFFAENTAPENPQNSFWRTRSAAWYQALFDTQGVRTHVVGSYSACGNEVSVFAGIKAD